MEIIRQGTYAKRGRFCINLNDPEISWNESKKNIKLWKENIKDFHAKSRHDYSIEISLEEATHILSAIAEAANRNPDLFNSINPTILKSLLQIQAAIIQAPHLQPEAPSK